MKITMDEFVRDYSGNISQPIVEGKKVGFQLSSGIRWFFSNTFISTESKKILHRRYVKLGLVEQNEKKRF